MLTHPSLTDFRLRLSLTCILIGVYLLVYVPRVSSIDGEAILGAAAATVRHGVPDIAVVGANDALLPFDMSRMGTFGLDGAYYSKKGVTPSVALVPLVVLAEASPWLDTRATVMLFNPLITTATALCLYTLVRWLGYKPRTAFVVALLYGVATFAIVYVKTLFGEPLAALLLLGAVMTAYLYRQRGDWRALILSGLLVGSLAGVNMIYLAVVPVIAVYLFGSVLRDKNRNIRVFIRDILIYGLSIGFFIGLLGLYNWARFGSPLNTGYHFASGEGFTKPFLEGVYGLTVGPYRGLFWYNPLLLLVIPGWLMLRRKFSALAWLVLALVVLQIASFASWWSWDGGIVWGPRFLLTVTPLLVICLAPLVEAAWEKRGIAAALFATTIISIGVQLLGALYSIYPYVFYMYSHYYVPELSGLSPEVLTTTGLSAILGHLALAVDGWSLEPAWAANGVDVVHVACALTVIGLGIGVWLWRARDRRAVLRIALAGAVVMVVSLNLVVARQQGNKEASEIHALENTLQPRGRVIAATTHFGESLVDIDNGSWVFATNAPTAVNDPLSFPMWNYATGVGGNIWLVTWFGPDDPANWQERDLWSRGAFAFERETVGHRALLFNLSPMPAADREVGAHFGDFTLDKYGTEQTDSGLLVMVQWSPQRLVTDDDSWFIHVVDSSGNVIAQQDRQPQGGYMPTSTWKMGESVTDRLYFPGLKGDDLRLRIGWVDPATQNLLPMVDRDGNAVPDNFILVPVDK
ncbi:MAG: hypothetical protein ABI690_06690 [Chloroflexota bacterium]